MHSKNKQKMRIRSTMFDIRFYATEWARIEMAALSMSARFVLYV